MALIAMKRLKTCSSSRAKAFDAFKKSHDERSPSSRSSAATDDPVLIERMGKIEKSLDAGVEAKAKIEAAIKAEKKEREELELKLGRLNLSGHSEEAPSARSRSSRSTTRSPGLPPAQAAVHAARCQGL
jgi:hypothetical protein